MSKTKFISLFSPIAVDFKIYFTLLFIVILSIFNNHKVFSNTDFNLLNHVGYTNARVFISSDENLSIAEILDTTNNIQFLTVPEGQPVSPHKVYWYKIDMNGIDLSVADQWIIRFPPYNQITLYFQKNNVPYFCTNSLTDINSEDKYHTITDLPFSQHELFKGRYLYARIKNTVKASTLKDAFYANLFAVEFDHNYPSREKNLLNIPYYIFIGGMLLMIFYFFGIYFMYKDKLYILYSLYLLSLLLYLGVRAPIIYFELDSYFHFHNYVFNEIIQVTVNIFYLQFAAIFLKARTDFPKLFIAIRIVVRILVAIVVLQLVLLFSGKYEYLEHYLINFERWFVILFTFGSYYYIIKHYKDRIVLFILWGSSFFLAGAIIALVYSDVKYMMLGASIEVFVFSLGMGYRIKLLAEEKQLIEAEIDHVKLTALRAQMNPHFIFNSLNSIRAYVISNEIKKASDYLTKFAKLIRLILYYSSKNKISLKEEIDALTLYVELEQMRYRKDFGFKITVHSPVDPLNMLVPPLILQPYVENAIRHGLAPGKEENKLVVDVRIVNGLMEFCIRDNGVGRKFHDKPSNSVKSDHKSMAMELTKKRIDLSAKDSEAIENIIVNDIKDGDLPAGTEVILKLPVSTRAEYVFT